MKACDDPFNLRNSYGYTNTNMMTQDKDAAWNQALQSFVQPTQGMVSVRSQGLDYQQTNNTNTFISLQQVPRGITVFQPVMSPVVNTGIVVDFRNNSGTPMPNAFNSPAPQVASVPQNRFELQQTSHNGYNQILQTQVAQPNTNGYGNYAPPPSYASYLQTSQSTPKHNQSMTPTVNSPNMNNQTLTVIHGGQMINNASQPTLSTMMTNQQITPMYNNNQQQQIMTRNVQLNSPNLLIPNNQPVSVNNNTRVINVPPLTSNGMTITRSNVTTNNTVVETTNMYRKEGNIVTPTLSQLLDRGVKANYQENPKLIQMLKNQNVTTNPVVQNSTNSPVVQKQAITVTSIPITVQNLSVEPMAQKTNSSPLVQLLNGSQKPGTSNPSRDEEKVIFKIPDNKLNQAVQDNITSQLVTAKPNVPGLVNKTNQHIPENKDNQPSTSNKPAPPRKARLKISPRLGNDAKRKMWFSHFEPKEDKIEEEETLKKKPKLPETDENNKWNMSQFRKCYVKVTKLPPEIEDIYFAKGNYKKSKEPLVYVVPNHKVVRFKPIKREKVDTTPAPLVSVLLETPVEGSDEVKKDPPLKTILKIKKVKKKNEAYKVMETNKDNKELKTTIKKCKIKRSNRRSERAKCSFCNKMRKPADNWRHVMAIYSKNVDEKDQISIDQVKADCDLCGTKVCSKAALKAHQENVHEKGEQEQVPPFECFICKKRLKTEEFLEFHLQTHYHDEEIDGGKVNVEVTETPEDLVTNKCEVCQRSFQTGCALASHLKVHGIFPENKCSICSKVFLKASQLKAHSVVHTDERPFECKECDKTFRFRSSLKQHSYSHQGIFPYKCKICSKAFVANWSLSHHMKRAHKTSAGTCRICLQTFPDKLCLNTHMKLYHGKKSPKKKSKEEVDIEQLRETLLKQLADEEDELDAATETDEQMNEDDTVDHDLDDLEKNMELECELCDTVFTSVSEMEKHLTQYHRVKDNKLSRLLYPFK